ncbi:unnamed protein product, partial [Symbiodinium necroappetens]
EESLPNRGLGLIGNRLPPRGGVLGQGHCPLGPGLCRHQQHKPSRADWHVRNSPQRPGRACQCPVHPHQAHN